ncbi:MAG: DUF1254 domain-containing protein, partial [Alphaproteobacteria bacterium]|nr:DUF1254 domain-containing protein [Alphaproteobacteria bacterium]
LPIMQTPVLRPMRDCIFQTISGQRSPSPRHFSRNSPILRCTRWEATANDANPLRQRLNRFFHIPVLADHRSRMVTTPNNDTLYSIAWLDLSVEPLFLTVPPVGNLYYNYAFIDLFTDNFAYVSHRLYGGQPPPHMIVGPDWKGDAPSDVTLVRAPTNSVWLLGRILVDGPEELERVRILQARVLLETPDMRNERRILETRELMRQRTVAPPEPVADWPAPHRADPFDLFEVGMQALGESPVPERDRALLEQLVPLRLRPGRKFDLRAFGESEQRAIRAGIEQGHAEIRNAGGRFGRTVDGWTYGERDLGNFGTNYLYRAVVALGGLGALEPAEAVYVTCNADSAGRPLDGSQRYELTFPAGGLPPARAFWSLAMYEVTPEGRAFFVDNPIGRYAIGDRTRDLFDRFHVVVAQAEVMADLVDQHMPHDMRQVFAGLAPIVEDRAAIEEDAVDVVGDVAGTALHHRDALVEAEQIERRVEFHLLLDLVGRKVVDLDSHVADMPAKLLGNRGQRLGGDRLEILQAGRKTERWCAPRVREHRHDSPI